MGLEARPYTFNFDFDERVSWTLKERKTSLKPEDIGEQRNAEREKGA